MGGGIGLSLFRIGMIFLTCRPQGECMISFSERRPEEGIHVGSLLVSYPFLWLWFECYRDANLPHSMLPYEPCDVSINLGFVFLHLAK